MPSTRRTLSVAELPPKPDSVTGLPRPPHAPGFFGRDVPFETDEFREHDPAQRPSPPEGQGPVLTWFRKNQKSARIGAIGLGLLLVAMLCIRNGFGWLENPKYWAVWLLVLGFAAYIYFTTRHQRPSAGAEWLARGKKWVRTYELVKVTCYTTLNGAYLRLVDGDGRKMWYPLVDFGLDDRLLWDLTYNGILHSVIAGGAKTNGMARRAIALPDRVPEPMPEEREGQPATWPPRSQCRLVKNLRLG